MASTERAEFNGWNSEELFCDIVITLFAELDTKRNLVSMSIHIPRMSRKLPNAKSFVETLNCEEYDLRLLFFENGVQMISNEVLGFKTEELKNAQLQIAKG